MIQVMEDQELIDWARRTWPLLPEAGQATRQQRELIHALCDALERRIGVRPEQRKLGWKGAWNLFDRRRDREDKRKGEERRKEIGRS